MCTDAEIGGAERFLASYASASRSEDTVALAVLMGPGALSPLLETSFDEVRYLGFPPTSRNLPGMIRALEGYIREFAPDVVSSHLFHADLVTALARTSVPKTTTVHTQALSPQDHPLTRLIARAVGMLSFRFSAVIPSSPSEQMSRFIHTLGMKNVVHAIPNAAAIPEQPSFDPKSRRLISLARNHPVKGHRRLFEAFTLAAPQNPGWKLVAHGPDVLPDNPAMLEAIKQAHAIELFEHGRIVLAGPTSEPERVLGGSAALVISSIYGESFPIVGAEAAALGIPVITTDLGSCSEFADDPRFLVPPDDALALAAALRLYMASNDEERIELSRLARRRAEERYHPRIAYERYRNQFKSLIDQRITGAR